MSLFNLESGVPKMSYDDPINVVVSVTPRQFLEHGEDVIQRRIRIAETTMKNAMNAFLDQARTKSSEGSTPARLRVLE